MNCEHVWMDEHCIERPAGQEWGGSRVHFRTCGHCGIAQEAVTQNLYLEEDFGSILNKGLGMLDAYLDLGINDDTPYACLHGYVDINAERLGQLLDYKLIEATNEAKQKQIMEFVALEKAVKVLKEKNLIPESFDHGMDDPRPNQGQPIGVYTPPGLPKAWTTADV